MKVRLRNSDLPNYKRYLRAAFPGLKASVRMEAMARGLGFKSYSTLLSAISSSRQTCALSEDRFIAYSERHGYVADRRQFSRASVRVMLKSVLDLNDRLTTHGYHLPDRFGGAGPKYTSEFSRARAEFYQDAFCDQFELALLLLQCAERRKTLNRNFTTYNLKHTAENISRKHLLRTDLGNYVCNGVFIAAAIYEEFDVRPTSWDSMSGYLNISSKSRAAFKDGPTARNILMRENQHAA